MILVTGGTGFIGRVLLRHLAELGYPVRTLIRPSPRSPNLPRGVPVDVTVSSLNDPRGLRAAMVGIDTVFHLASSEWRTARANLMQTEVEGARAVVEAASDAGVKRICYVSYLGADRASAFPVFKVKAIAEEFIRRSKMEHIILRTAIVYGENDNFTTGLARIMAATPFVFLYPGDGRVMLQPLWVEDLVTCMVWSLDQPDMLNRTIEVGGPEYLSLAQVAELVMQEAGLNRRLIGVSPPFLRGLTMQFDSMFPNFPVSSYWLDYLAVNRTTALDTMPRVFNLMPSRMSQRLGYLREQKWGRLLMRSLFKRRV